MSSDKPLLFESEPFSTPDPQLLHHSRQSSLRIISFRCLRRGRSFSSWVAADETEDSNLKELDKDFAPIEGASVTGNSLEHPAFQPGRKVIFVDNAPKESENALCHGVV